MKTLAHEKTCSTVLHMLKQVLLSHTTAILWNRYSVQVRLKSPMHPGTLPGRLYSRVIPHLDDLLLRQTEPVDNVLTPRHLVQ